MKDIKTKTIDFYQSIAIFQEKKEDTNIIKYIYSDIHTTKRKAENDIGRKIEKLQKNFGDSVIIYHSIYHRTIEQQQLLESSVNEIDIIDKHIIIK